MMTTFKLFNLSKFISLSCFSVVAALALLSSELLHANELLMSQLSASKQFDGGFSLIAAGGNVYERYKGKFSYLGISGKTQDGTKWQTGVFGYYPKKEGGGYQKDNRARGSISYQVNLDGWQFAHRSRLEYRYGDLAKGFRYRPAFELSHPLHFDHAKLIPYVELEPFYDFTEDKVTVVLLTTGVKWPINRSLFATAGHFNILATEDDIHTKGILLGLHLAM